MAKNTKQVADTKEYWTVRADVSTTAQNNVIKTQALLQLKHKRTVFMPEVVDYMLTNFAEKK